MNDNLLKTNRTTVYFVGGRTYSSREDIPWRQRSNPTCVLKLKEKDQRSGERSVVSIQGERSGLFSVGSFRSGLCGTSGIIDTAIGYLIGSNITEKARVRLTGRGDVEALDCTREGDTRKIAVGPDTIRRTLGRYVDLDTRDYRGIAVAATHGGQPCAGRETGKNTDSNRRSTVPSGSRVLREGTVR